MVLICSSFIHSLDMFPEIRQMDWGAGPTDDPRHMPCIVADSSGHGPGWAAVP